MNRSRYKTKDGSLDIKDTPPYKTEQKALDAYEGFTKSGFALQLKKIKLQPVYLGKVINWYRQDPVVIKENDRWKFRLREYKISRLISQIAELEKNIQTKKTELAELEKQE